MRNDHITDEFILALQDYAYLLNRQYSRKTILKIAGDRYLLNSFQRILLSRGVFSDVDVKKRIRKRGENISGEDLYIDAYNVLFTLCNYLLGRLVFIGNDLFVRDTGEIYGKPNEDPVFSRAIELCFNYLRKFKPSGVVFLLDKPLSYSAELAVQLRELLELAGLTGDARIDKNPDEILIRQTRGIVISSDSDILDHTDQTILDLAHLILEDNFKPELPDLGKLLN